VESEIYIFVGLVSLIAIWLLYAALNSVEGIWRREDAEDEFLQLEQFGPFVTGKRNVDGGNHIYSGTLTFGTLKLVRRDWGIPHLIAAGFPAVIAKKINGSVMAKVRLRRRTRKRLEGVFVPQKILFDEPSARVLSRDYQHAIERNYVLTDLNTLPQSKAAKSGPRSASLPPPTVEKKKRGNTF
jgi:hypothetical protein